MVRIILYIIVIVCCLTIIGILLSLGKKREIESVLVGNDDTNSITLLIFYYLAKDMAIEKGDDMKLIVKNIIIRAMNNEEIQISDKVYCTDEDGTESELDKNEFADFFSKIFVDSLLEQFDDKEN